MANMDTAKMSTFCVRTIALFILFASQHILGQNVSHSHNQHTLTSLIDGNSPDAGHPIAAMVHATPSLNRTTKNVPSTKQPEQPEYETTMHHHPDSVNLTNVLRLENVLEVFNIRDVAKLWQQSTDQYTPECANDMHAYLHGLQQHKSWATKSKSTLQYIFNRFEFRTRFISLSGKLLCEKFPPKKKDKKKRKNLCGVN